MGDWREFSARVIVWTLENTVHDTSEVYRNLEISK